MSVSEFDYQTLLEKSENEELEELAVVYHQLGCLSKKFKSVDYILSTIN